MLLLETDQTWNFEDDSKNFKNPGHLKCIALLSDSLRFRCHWASLELLTFHTDHSVQLNFSGLQDE
jgi:hypothetical protein